MLGRGQSSIANQSVPAISSLRQLSRNSGYIFAGTVLGLTSPVGGPSGRFAVDSNGSVVIESGRFPDLTLDPARPTQVRRKNRLSTRALALAIQRADAE